MVVVSSREFRANQRKYFALARNNDVVITSRSHGSYRLVPILEDDTVISHDELDAKIRKGIEDYAQGKVFRMNEGESSEDYLNRLISFLRSGGVDFQEPGKNATEVSAKYDKSIVRVKFPGKGSTASLLQIDY